MELIALVIAAAALFVSLFVALACAELARRVGSEEPADGSHLTELALEPHVVGARPSELGLPPRLDDAHAEIVLFISPMCRTCHDLASSLADGLPPGLSVVATAGHPTRLRGWIAEKGIEWDVTYDDDGSIASRLGITGSPAAIGVADGAVVFGAFLGGRDALESLLAQRRRFSDGYQPQEISKH